MFNGFENLKSQIVYTVDWNRFIAKYRGVQKSEHTAVSQNRSFCENSFQYWSHSEILEF